MAVPRQTLQVLQASTVNTDLGRSVQVRNGWSADLISEWGEIRAFHNHKLLCCSQEKSFQSGNSGAQNKFEVQRE